MIEKSASQFIDVAGLTWVSLIMLYIIGLTTENLKFLMFKDILDSKHINQICYESLPMETTSENSTWKMTQIFMIQ